MHDQLGPWNKAGAKVPNVHLGPCGGRLDRITTYGADIVTCERCEAEFAVEERFGALIFAEGRDA